MAVPKKKMSKSRSRMRRAHQALALPNRSPCSQCGAPRESHRVCAACGDYRGRQIFKVEKEQEA